MVVQVWVWPDLRLLLAFIHLIVCTQTIHYQGLLCFQFSCLHFLKCLPHHYVFRTMKNKCTPLNISVHNALLWYPDVLYYKGGMLIFPGNMNWMNESAFIIVLWIILRDITVSVTESISVNILSSAQNPFFDCSFNIELFTKSKSHIEWILAQ